MLFLSPCTCSGVPVNNMMCRKLDVFIGPGTYFWVAKNCIVTVAKKAFGGGGSYFFFLLILLDLLHFTGNWLPVLHTSVTQCCVTPSPPNA